MVSGLMIPISKIGEYRILSLFAGCFPDRTVFQQLGAEYGPLIVVFGESGVPNSQQLVGSSGLALKA